MRRGEARRGGRSGSRAGGPSVQQPGRGRRSLETVQDLALQAVLDLAAPQHQLQHLVHGMLRVFLRTQGRLQEHASQGTWDTPLHVSFLSLHTGLSASSSGPALFGAFAYVNSLHPPTTQCSWHVIISISQGGN